MTAAPAAGYLSITRRSLDLEDYIDIVRRHIGWILGPAFAGLVVSMVVAFLIPNVYVSQAEMEITPAQISANLVPAAVTQQLSDRIVYMQNQILSRQSLSGIIQDPRLDLYKEDRAKLPLDDVIDEMQRNVHVNIVSVDSSSGRRASAFTIAFAYPDRVKARDTVAMLVTKFNDANQRAQHQVQETVNGFTSAEVTEAKASLDKWDEELTKFRTANPGRLPEQAGINISELTTLTGQLGGVNDALNRLSQDKLSLQTRLSTVNAQLDNYRLFDQSSTDPASPVGRQNERLINLERTIIQMESDLDVMRKTFKETYPDVRDAEKRLEVLKAERDSLRKKQDEANKARDEEIAKTKGDGISTTNFGLAQSLTNLRGEISQIKTQMKLIDEEIARRQKQQEAITAEIEVYKARLAATSGIEAQYEEVLRQERAANDKYQDLIHKQQIVDENVDLVQRQAGEQLNVLDPASLPEKPASPKRLRYVGMGFAASFIIGLVLAGVQEARDPSLKNLKDVRAYTNLPVLSSIPLLENSALVKRKRRVAYLSWSAGIIVGVIAVSCALYYHYFVAP